MRLTCALLVVAAVSAIAHADDAALSPYLTRDGQPADASLLKMTEHEAGFSLSFTAPDDGVYQVGLAVAAPAVTLLSPDQRAYTREDLAEPLVLRYPYDWTVATKRNVMGWATRLVMPGAIAGDRVFLVDTHELTSVRAEDNYIPFDFLDHTQQPAWEGSGLKRMRCDLYWQITVPAATTLAIQSGSCLISAAPL